MNHRAVGFVSLLAVIGVSIVFGVLVGGRLNAPRVALAAPPSGPIVLAPAAAQGPGVIDFADVVEQAMPAVVSVTARSVDKDDDPREGNDSERMFEWFFGPQQRERQNAPRTPTPRIGEGSGFVISRDGYILTNNHVIEDADQISIGMQDGKNYTASVVGTDPSIDLALLKIDAGGAELPALPLGDSSRLRVGEWVIAIGNPLDYEQTVTVGVVSAKERRVPIGSTDSGVVSFIQTDAAINFGNSGGPLIDSRGNVIGINTAIRRANFAEGIGFALPIAQARRVIDQLRETGSVRRGYIGISMHTEGVDDAVREYFDLPDKSGVLVDSVNPGGPADRAGLRGGDIIRKVDGEKVRDNLDLIDKISSRQPDTRVQLDIFRDGKARRLNVTLEDREEGLRAQGGSRGPGDQREEEQEPQESSGLGFTVEKVPSALRERLGMEPDDDGVVVTRVEFDGPAAEKGIAPNMIVQGINGRKIRTVVDFNAALADLSPGDVVKLDLRVGRRSTFVFMRAPG